MINRWLWIYILLHGFASVLQETSTKTQPDIWLKAGIKEPKQFTCATLILLLLKVHSGPLHISHTVQVARVQV